MHVVTLDTLTVLLVESSRVQLNILQRMLGELGLLVVHTARTGADALALVDEHPIDVVVSSLYLEDMTGDELAEQLQSNPRWEEVGFVLMSSETRWDRLDPVRQAGSAAILEKPFAPRDLGQALQATVNRINAEFQGDANEELEHLHVLLVDDAVVARKYVARSLRKLGLSRIIEAGHGQEGVEAMERQIFDLVVTDYNMPVMDGCAFVQHIRTESNQGTVPVLMVTSEDNAERLDAARVAGVNVICNKPFDIEELRELLQSLLPVWSA